MYTVKHVLRDYPREDHNMVLKTSGLLIKGHFNYNVIPEELKMCSLNIIEVSQKRWSLGQV